MSRHAHLEIMLVIVLMTTGCIGSTSTGNSPTATSPENSPLTPKALPDQPEKLTRENAIQFAKKYERRYTLNQKLSNNTIDMSVNPVHAEILKETDAGYIVHLEVAFVKKIRIDGQTAVGEGFYTVNYFINGTTILRAQVGGQERPGPSPRNGTTLEG